MNNLSILQKDVESCQ